MYYRTFLTDLHRRLQPQAYLEIGVRNGRSLALAQCTSVGIDPAYAIKAELQSEVHLFRTSSDEYFSRPDPLQPTGGRRFDLAFIDGLHLFEFAFRDFINAERHSTSRGVIIFDDMLPRKVDEAARVRHTKAWTGDVYGMLAVLAEYRPDLCVVTVDTRPTGLLMITGLDPENTTLADNYHQILDRHLHPDPQPVPEQLMERLTVPPPEKVLQSSVFELLAGAARDTPAAELRPRIAEIVERDLGVAFVPQG